MLCILEYMTYPSMRFHSLLESDPPFYRYSTFATLEPLKRLSAYATCPTDILLNRCTLSKCIESTKLTPCLKEGKDMLTKN